MIRTCFSLVLIGWVSTMVAWGQPTPPEPAPSSPTPASPANVTEAEPPKDSPLSAEEERQWLREQRYLELCRQSQLGTLPHIPLNLEEDFHSLFNGALWLNPGLSLQLTSIGDVGNPGNPFSLEPSNLTTGANPKIVGGLYLPMGTDARLSLRRSRVSLDVYTPFPKVLDGLRFFTEVDFQSKDGSPNVRHAVLRTRYLMIGRTDSAFRDVSAEPETIDSGPNGYFGLRQQGVRLIIPWETYQFAVALEDQGGILTPEGTALSDGRLRNYPDFAAHFRAQQEWGHVQLAGILRRLQFAQYPGQVDSQFPGWGVGLSGKVYTHDKDNLSFEAALGDGLGRYLNDLSATQSELGLDAQGRLGTQFASGGFVSYQHWWDDSTRTNIYFSMASVNLRAGQPDDAYQLGRNLGINVMRDMSKQCRVGLEYVHAWLRLHDGSTASGGRFQMMLRNNF